VGRVRCNILGETPMIMHRFDTKAWQELLFPKSKGNRVDRELNLKHDPVGEFRGALYLNRNASEPAAVHVPAGAFSAAISNAALDLPGASKSQIKRSYGKFRVVSDDDADFLRIVKTQGRKAQEAAIAKPVCADADSEELLTWFHAELKTREKAAPSAKLAAPPKAKAKRNGREANA
jgi:hypothetical protein